MGKCKLFNLFDVSFICFNKTDIKTTLSPVEKVVDSKKVENSKEAVSSTCESLSIEDKGYSPPKNFFQYYNLDDNDINMLTSG